MSVGTDFDYQDPQTAVDNPEARRCLQLASGLRSISKPTFVGHRLHRRQPDPRYLQGPRPPDARLRQEEEGRRGRRHDHGQRLHPGANRDRVRALDAGSVGHLPGARGDDLAEAEQEDQGGRPRGDRSATPRSRSGGSTLCVVVGVSVPERTDPAVASSSRSSASSMCRPRAPSRTNTAKRTGAVKEDSRTSGAANGLNDPPSVTDLGPDGPGKSTIPGG